MKALVQEKEKAIAMRHKGLTYKEILIEIPVAKSSLLLWLKNLPLTEQEKKYLRKRRDANITKGRIRSAAARRNNNLEKQKILFNQAKQEFQSHKDDTLFHVGIALYWAEGAKRSNSFQFMNSDHEMVETMLLWLERFTEYTRDDIGYRLFIHKPYAHENCEEWWAGKLKVSPDSFKKTVYKPSGLGVKKRPQYKGCLRVEVPRGTLLLRKMKFWQNIMIEYYRNR